MTRGYGGSQPDPFGPEPVGSSSATQPYESPPVTHGFPPDAPPAFPPPSGPRAVEPNTLATLSIVFAVVFAPAGAILGHVALSQLKQSGQRGRERAIVGLTLSYVIIALAVVALLIWLILRTGSARSPVPPSPIPAQTTTSAAPALPPRTTVITPPPQRRPTVSVEQLRVGDCVEVQQTEPDPTSGPDTNVILIFPVRCEVRDGVFRVDEISSTKSCPVQALFNRQETVFACISDYRG